MLRAHRQHTGETFHIGRRHVEDSGGEPVVVEWRAPVAVPFYRANPSSPLGLRRRRQFVVDGRRIQSMADDVLSGRAGADAPRLRGGDALLAELERSRGAEMLDIVATIQAEQDEVIRSPLAGVLVVQGGPGSGKTAVGLHRAAFLLYGDEALARQGMLVLGPNRVFLRYIAQVLPSLGEEAVVQTTVGDLAAGIRVVAQDHPEADRVKGDARMAAVLAQALATGRRPLDADVVVPVGLRRLALEAAAANSLALGVADRRLAYEVGRQVLRDALVGAVVARHPGAGTAEHAGVERSVRSSPALGSALDRLWPSVSPAALVRALVTKKAVLARAAIGVLSTAEQAALLRPATPTESLEIPSSALPPPAWELRAAAAATARVAASAAASTVGEGAAGRQRRARLRDPWTPAEVALLDEASALVSGEGRTYGHVVVDEAQDLSPMQLRMIGRRAPGGSVTLLGDLAQGSGVWAPDRWASVVEHLATPAGWRLAELRLGYRSPADVLSLATRLLAVAAPGVAPPEAVRSRRGGVAVIEAARTAREAGGEEAPPGGAHGATGAAKGAAGAARAVAGATSAAAGAAREAAGAAPLPAVVAGEAARLAATYGSVAVIAAAGRLDDLDAALTAAGIDVGRAAGAGGLDRRVTLVEAHQAKGLEFDAVVVADPAAIVASAPDTVRGLRLLYVALTRPTQGLAIVHGGDLRAALLGASLPPPTGLQPAV